MRVCLISREFPPETGWGGIGTFMFHLANQLADSGNDVHVVSLCGNRQGAKNERNNLTIHRVPAGKVAGVNSLFNFCFPVTRPMLDETSAIWQRVVNLHREQPFDVIECPEHFAEGLFAALSRIAPLVLRLHTPHSKLVKERMHNFQPTFDHRVLTALERVAMISADMLISPSEDLAAYVANDLNLPLGRIKIVRNPVDTKKFTPEGNKAFETPGLVNILFVGRLEARKGVHYLVQAIPHVIRACPNARFVILGSDTQTGTGNSSVLGELQAVLSEHDCADAVRFVDHIPLDEIPDYYRSADICVLPSLYDNAPMTVIEAMSCGKPVVASAAGGAKEYALDGICGRIVPPADVHTLALALIELVNDANLRQRMGENGRHRALTEFTVEKMANDTIALYEQAREKFARREGGALYTGTPESLHDDLMQLVHDMDRRLYQMLFTHSWRFRLKHWQKKARELFQ